MQPIFDKAPVLLGTLVLLSGCAGGNMLVEGKPAPALTASAKHAVEDIEGKAADLDQLRRNGPVVLVFLRGFG